MRESMTLRDARPEDAEGIVDIALAAWEPFFDWLREHMGEDMYRCFHPDWRAEKRRHVTEPLDPDEPGRAIVAEAGGRIVGFVCYYMHEEAGWGEIGNNAVSPDCQGRGIGPALYRRAMDRMRGAGLRYVRVGTGCDEFHARARRAYAGCGFSTAVAGVTYHREL